MRERCNNPKCPGYPRYGGRGIRVCNEWRDFSVFLTDMGEKPTKEHSLDRIDNNGNYTKDNCRWVTEPEQQRNRSDNVWLTVDGITLVQSDWAIKCGISLGTIRSRINLRGWAVEEAIKTPPGAKRYGK